MKTIRFIICAFGALFLSAAVAGAQGKYQNVELTIDHKDGRYQKGEVVEVWATRLVDDGEKLSLSIRENGKWTSSPLELNLEEKTLVLSRSFDIPTSVVLQVKPASDKSIYSSVGFIVAPEEFRPGFDEPADFMEFWQGQVKKMRKSKIKAKLTPVELPAKHQNYNGEIVAYDLEISMPEGNPVRAYIAWPVDAKPGTLGILVNPHGAGVRSSNLGNAVWKAHSYHCVSIDINAHGILNGQSDEFYDNLSKGELKGYRTMKAAGKEDSYFRLMYLRMQRVLDYACTMKLWDGKRVALDGTSQGGGQSAALAGLDPRVGFTILHVPALTDIGGPFAGHSGSWPYYGKFDEERDGNYQLALPYYDAVNFLRHYKGILIMEGGLIDTTCPPECVFSAFNVAASSDKSIATYPYRHHGEKQLWKKNLEDWAATINEPRKERLKDYLK